ncbi:MAG: hypothetical protein ACXWNL_02490 [Vulcanimicrobiaceae bacterium]
MLRHSRLCHGELTHEVAGRALALGEQFNDLPAPTAIEPLLRTAG